MKPALSLMILTAAVAFVPLATPFHSSAAALPADACAVRKMPPDDPGPGGPKKPKRDHWSLFSVGESARFAGPTA